MQLIKITPQKQKLKMEGRCSRIRGAKTKRITKFKGDE